MNLFFSKILRSINWLLKSIEGQVILKTFFPFNFQKNLLTKLSFGYPEILKIIFDLFLKILFSNNGNEVIKCIIRKSGLWFNIIFNKGIKEVIKIIKYENLLPKNLIWANI